MTHLPDEILKKESFQAFLADIRALGVEQVAVGGQRYAIVSARSNLRWWLIPLEESCAAAAGFEMLQPVTRSASAAKILARCLARFGLYRFLRPHQFRVSGLPDILGAFDGRAAHVAYFTGTDGPHRKTAMQVMDSKGEILGYGKFSRASHVRPYLRHEAKILGQVAGLDLKSANVPSVVVMRDEGNFTFLITDSTKSAAHVTSIVLGAKQIAFLKELRTKTARRGADKPLEKLFQRVKSMDPLIGKDWTERLLRVYYSLYPVVKAIPVCLAHGDFTPWNTFEQGGRLYVFDWEYADVALPVGFDLAHFQLATMSPGLQIESIPALTQALAETHFDGDSRAARRALLLSLACHASFYLNRLGEVHSPLATWTEGPMRAEMIDRLLSEHEEAP